MKRPQSDFLCAVICFTSSLSAFDGIYGRGLLLFMTIIFMIASAKKDPTEGGDAL